MTMEVPEIPNLPRHRKSKNQPKDSAWRQQKLPARRPVLTIQAVFPSVMGLGLIIFGLGLLIYFAAEDSKQFVYDYTNCLTKNGTKASYLALNLAKPTCTVDITITEDFKGEVKFYYQLEGFYQNFRLYSNSRNDLQLLGDLYETDQCDPYDCVPAEGYVVDVNTSCKTSEYNAGRAIPIVPCGTIANSMFNDSFQLIYHHPDGTKIPVPFTVDGVMAHVERMKKFRNPHDYPDDSRIREEYPGSMCDQFNKSTKPPNWQSSICELGVFNASEDNLDIGWALNNIDFQVWMKTAALPNFRKPYRSLDKSVDPFNDGGKDALLPKGNYTLIINYNYNVIQFKISKSFVIGNPSWIGPRNFFLPILYMITGCFIIVAMSALFIIAQVKARYFKETT